MKRLIASAVHTKIMEPYQKISMDPAQKMIYKLSEAFHILPEQT